MGGPLTPPVAKRLGETTSGGLSRPFREIASSTPEYPIPKPPRITVFPPHFSGDHAKPICGPKLLQGVFHRLPPSTSRMPVKAVVVVGPSSARLRLFSLEYKEPKYSQRKPKFNVKVGRMRQSSWKKAPQTLERMSFLTEVGLPFNGLNEPNSPEGPSFRKSQMLLK